MRIGLLTTSFPRTPHDSAGGFVLGFARALIERGAHVEVLAPEPREGIAPMREPGLDVRHVRYLWPRSLQRTFYGAGVPDNLRRDPLAWLGLLPFTLALARQAQIASEHWDAVVSHWALPCALVAARAVRTKPHLAVLHSADVHALCRLPNRAQWAQRIARGANGMWFVTRAHRDRFLELLPAGEREPARSRTCVAPMGIQLPEIAPGDRERARRDLALTRFSVLALGRLVPVKGIDVLLRASRDRQWTLLIAGEGPERALWQAEARRLGVDARFLGEVANIQKRLLLTAADAFALPSRVLPSGRSEGSPVALLEAMSFGLPIVASAVGGIAELLPCNGTAGMLVPPDHPEQLANALELLRLDAGLRASIGTTARKLAERHCWSRAIEPALSVLSAPRRHPEISPTP
jgi:glycosyltransferase involved in cell wall biosynthesis